MWFLFQSFRTSPPDLVVLNKNERNPEQLQTVFNAVALPFTIVIFAIRQCSGSTSFNVVPLTKLSQTLPKKTRETTIRNLNLVRNVHAVLFPSVPTWYFLLNSICVTRHPSSYFARQETSRVQKRLENTPTAPVGAAGAAAALIGAGEAKTVAAAPVPQGGGLD